MRLGRIGRYLLRETLWSWLAVTTVLVAVLLTNRLVRFLAEAASGDIPADAVFTLLGLKALANLGTLLPASFFLAVILAFGRLYRDSEMAAMAACGIGARLIYRALFALALPLAAAVAVLALWLGPWAERTVEGVIAEAGSRLSLSGVPAGQFTALGERGMVYLEGFSESGEGRGLFAWLPSPGGDHVVVADSARGAVDPDTGVRRLVLENGTRYRLPGPEGLWSVIDFRAHGIRMPSPSPPAAGGGRDAIPSGQLWGASYAPHRAELLWRLSAAVSTLVLTLVALPLARSAPRQGRYGRLVAAVLLYITYFNLLKAMQDWSGNGLVSPELGMAAVHALFLAFGAGLLLRQYGWPGARVA